MKYPKFILLIVAFALVSTNAFGAQISVSGFTSETGTISLTEVADYWSTDAGQEWICDEVAVNFYKEIPAGTAYGTVYDCKGTFTVLEGMSFQFEVAPSETGGSGVYITLNNANIDGTFDVSRVKNQYTSLAYGGNTVLNGSFITHNLRIGKSSASDILGNTLTITSKAGRGSLVVASSLDTRAALGANCKIVFNSAWALCSAVTRNDDNSIKSTQHNTGLAMMSANACGKLQLDIGASQQIGTIQYQHNDVAVSDLVINFTDRNAVLISKNIVQYGDQWRGYMDGDVVYMTFENFQNDRMFFTVNMISQLENDRIAITSGGKTGYVALRGTDIYGNELKYFSFEAGKVLDANGSEQSGWWLVSAVPEPSTWAAIFGSVALAFAVWRKRK